MVAGHDGADKLGERLFRAGVHAGSLARRAAPKKNGSTRSLPRLLGLI
jgi:hypothetical protein